MVTWSHLHNVSQSHRTITKSDLQGQLSQPARGSDPGSALITSRMRVLRHRADPGPALAAAAAALWWGAAGGEQWGVSTVKGPAEVTDGNQEVQPEAPAVLTELLNLLTLSPHNAAPPVRSAARLLAAHEGGRRQARKSTQTLKYWTRRSELEKCSVFNNTVHKFTKLIVHKVKIDLIYIFM